MKKILCLLPSLLTLLALAGCCANNVCICQDELADALFFKINYTPHRQYSGTTPTSFSANDVDTIRIYRITRSPVTPKDTIIDSVTVARPHEYRGGDTLIAPTATVVNTGGGTTTLLYQDLVVINNASPFASTGGKLSNYNYRIGIIRNASKRRKPLAIYAVSNIALQGRYDANGCCTCYQNTGKSYALAYKLGRLPLVDAVDSAGERKVVRLPFAPR
ncbi:MAG: hypothetical protein EOO36_12610 [Cytophagaceae bacterium]|nr:MAG: hypothetical protein EOO36_12610 [Cytophagaceae bacterium]